MTQKHASLEPLSRDGLIAVASSVTVFVVASVLFFIVGFLCGKERKTAETVPPPAEQIQAPYYDDVVLRQHEQELEMIAYAPVHSY